MPIPQGIATRDAASLPYVACIVWQSLFRKGNLPKDCSIMIHDGVGDFGPLAIQLAVHHGCTVFATARKEESSYCKKLGARHCFQYDDFVNSVLQETDRRGVDFVFDPIGESVSDNINILANGGTLVLTGGSSLKKVVDVEAATLKQLKFIGVNFLTLDSTEKDKLMEDVVCKPWPMFETGLLNTQINPKVYQFRDAPAAHEAMALHKNRGKVLLIPD